jgi:hypothetical protein
MRNLRKSARVISPSLSTSISWNQVGSGTGPLVLGSTPAPADGAAGAGAAGVGANGEGFAGGGAGTPGLAGAAPGAGGVWALAEAGPKAAAHRMRSTTRFIGDDRRNWRGISYRRLSAFCQRHRRSDDHATQSRRKRGNSAFELPQRTGCAIVDQMTVSQNDRKCLGGKGNFALPACEYANGAESA